MAISRRVYRFLRNRNKTSRYSRRKAPGLDSGIRSEGRTSCSSCGKHIDQHQLAVNLFVCPHCGHHFRINAIERVRTLLDGGEMSEFATDVAPGNPIDFPGYVDKVKQSRTKTGLDEAVMVGSGRIEGRPLVLGIMSFQFLGGSMGSVVGERLAQAILMGVDRRMPVAIFTASGGARMQEGVFSLMQMAKTSHAVALANESGTPVFLVLTDPTTGGVTASFAMVGDVTLAEPAALIGFAGPRVIEGTIRQKLPPGFQQAEFQLEKGFVDAVVSRKDLRSTLAYLIDSHPVRSQ